MKNKAFIVLLVFCVLLAVWVQRGNAQDKIVGPWLWMCVQVDGIGGAVATDQDTLKLESKGKVTEKRWLKTESKLETKLGNWFGVQLKSLKPGGTTLILLPTCLISVLAIVITSVPTPLSRLKPPTQETGR